MRPKAIDSAQRYPAPNICFSRARQDETAPCRCRGPATTTKHSSLWFSWGISQRVHCRHGAHDDYGASWNKHSATVVLSEKDSLSLIPWATWNESNVLIKFKKQKNLQSSLKLAQGPSPTLWCRGTDPRGLYTAWHTQLFRKYSGNGPERCLVALHRSRVGTELRHQASLGQNSHIQHHRMVNKAKQQVCDAAEFHLTHLPDERAPSPFQAACPALW